MEHHEPNTEGYPAAVRELAQIVTSTSGAHVLWNIAGSGIDKRR